MPAEAQPCPIKFHLDAPSQWEDCPRVLVIRGWAFAPAPSRITAIRALIRDTPVPGTVGHHRPDVPTAYADAPDDFCGFQIAARTPTGKFTVEIQGQLAGGTWVTLHTQRARARSWRRPLALGGGTAEELLQAQLSLIPQHDPRHPHLDDLKPRRLNPRGSTVTVVTPSYQQAAWLEQNITSVNPERSDRIRQLVIDGGSTDGSVAILQKHTALLAAWVSESDEGQADAIAKGFDHERAAGTEIMAWLNADDHYLPGTLSFVQHYFDRHPEVDVIYGNRILIDENGAEVGRWILPAHCDAVLPIYDFVPQETLFWRRSIWEKVGGIDRRFQFAMDWDLLLRFAAQGARIRHLPRRLGAFRIHARQKSSAAIGSTGQQEIDDLRARTFGRRISPAEILGNRALQRYLRRSAWETWLDRWGIRRPVS